MLLGHDPRDARAYPLTDLERLAILAGETGHLPGV
jgi:hypothetical protein